MIQLIGISRNVSLDIREKFAIREKSLKDVLILLNSFCREAFIISTCNRTEIYFDEDSSNADIVDKIFEALNWEKYLKEYIFHVKEEKVTKHIMELACGFHSKILGEDQILGQIKDAYDKALSMSTSNGVLQRLFQETITCGKKFRSEAKLFEIPVSYPSIAVNKALQMKIKNYMVIGYGVMGSLAVKYILSHSIESLYIVVRDVNKVQDIKDPRVKIVPFDEKKQAIEKVECIISCTSAPYIVLKNSELTDGKEYLIFDLSMPRDVEKAAALRSEVKFYDVDTISIIDKENKKLRKQKMQESRFIIDKYIEDFEAWKKIRKLTPYIKNIKSCGEEVAKKRIETFNNKLISKDPKSLAESLIKSTSNFYINRAIEVLKDEGLNGSDEECLRIIKKIFMIT